MVLLSPLYSTKFDSRASDAPAALQLPNAILEREHVHGMDGSYPGQGCNGTRILTSLYPLCSALGLLASLSRLQT